MPFVTTRAYVRCPSSLRSQTSTMCALSRTQTTLSSSGAGWLTQTLAWAFTTAGSAAATSSTAPRIIPRAPTRTRLPLVQVVASRASMTSSAAITQRGLLETPQTNVSRSSA